MLDVREVAVDFRRCGVAAERYQIDLFDRADQVLRIELVRDEFLREILEQFGVRWRVRFA